MKTRSNPPPERECRMKPTKWLKNLVLDAQGHRCLGCNKRLDDVEYDHVVPLGLGGSNAPDNWAALCQVCHRRKTRLDLWRIAKAKRQRRYHETGRSRARTPSGGGSAFDKLKRRHLDGVVAPRCDCPDCTLRRRGGG